MSNAGFEGEFFVPTRISFGCGRIRRLAELTSGWGKRALLVTDPGVIASGAVEAVCGVLTSAGIDYGVFSDARPLPDRELIGQVMNRLNTGFDYLLAVGGGRCIDTAKAARLGCSGEIEGVPPWDRVPSLAAIPTTAGSGSEVDGHVAVALEGGRRLFSDLDIVPQLAVYDPELTLYLPGRITAAAGAGVAARCVDVLLQPEFHPMADAAAEDAVRRVVSFLPRAAQSGHDLESRVQMMAAAMMGGVAAAKGRGDVAALGEALSTIAGVQHGVAQSVVAAELLRDAPAGEAQERLARVFRCAPQDAAGRLRKFFDELSLPHSLQQAGVPAAMIPALVELSLEGHARQTPALRDHLTRVLNRLSSM